MSRIGKKPVAVPEGVKLSLQGRLIQVEGPLGKLQFEHRPEVSVNYDEQNRQVLVSRNGEDRLSRALHGTTRAIIQNMIVGVTKGYEKRLEVVGSGYLAALQGDTLELRVGLANEVRKKVPAGLQVTVPDQNHIVIKGVDKQQVGQFAAEVRAVRKPEPYKGKGIRYEGEHVRRKVSRRAGK